jgi:hypothetical protein
MDGPLTSSQIMNRRTVPFVIAAIVAVAAGGVWILIRGDTAKLPETATARAGSSALASIAYMPGREP